MWRGSLMLQPLFCRGFLMLKGQLLVYEKKKRKKKIRNKDQWTMHKSFIKGLLGLEFWFLLLVLRRTLA